MKCVMLSAELLETSIATSAVDLARDVLDFPFPRRWLVEQLFQQIINRSGSGSRSPAARKLPWSNDRFWPRAARERPSRS